MVIIKVSGEERRETHMHYYYNVPPNISDSAWLEAEKTRVEIEKEKLKIQEELEKKRLELQERLLTLAEKLAPEYKEYIKSKNKLVIIPSYIVILFIAGIATYLAAIGKISGETVAFLLGTLAGYAISITSEKR